MSQARSHPQRAPGTQARPGHTLTAGVLIFTAICLAYGNTLNAPFIFDDGPSIEDNRTIRSIFPLSQSLSPPSQSGAGVAGRPIVNLSLAINYAISEFEPWSYHATNILIHALAAITLFALVRTTLGGPVLRVRWAGQAGPVAFAVAFVWALHPLQTESVTCIIQRTESLMGLFFLLTLYAFARTTMAVSGKIRVGWALLCLSACALGMGTKEVMVTAPVIILLYDRTFISGHFSGIYRHRWLHYGLFSLWSLLFYLLQGNPLRGGTSSFESVTWWQYLLTQCEAIVMYLKLTVWPDPLVLDYGTYLAPGLPGVMPQAILLVLLAGATCWALWRRPITGFLGAWFFIILSPSSSVVPLVTQTMAEHRMYLPLLAPLALGVGALAQRATHLVLPIGIILGLLLGVVTFQRNQIYLSPRKLWQDNLEHRPQNNRVHNGLSGAADKEGDFAAAVIHYGDFLRHHPESTETRINYARDLVKVGRKEEALEQFERVVKELPTNMEVRTNYAACLAMLGRNVDAARQLELVLRVKPNDADDHFNYAEMLKKTGRLAEAIDHYRRAVSLRPKAGFMHYRLGDALIQTNRPAEAVIAYQAAVTHQPDLFPAWVNLGSSFMLLDRIDEAIRAYEAAQRIQPNDEPNRKNLEHARRLRR